MTIHLSDTAKPVIGAVLFALCAKLECEGVDVHDMEERIQSFNREELISNIKAEGFEPAEFEAAALIYWYGITALRGDFTDATGARCDRQAAAKWAIQRAITFFFAELSEGCGDEWGREMLL